MKTAPWQLSTTIVKKPQTMLRIIGGLVDLLGDL
jgi:hypothetical protein